jgi:hypothetical protein
VAERDEVLDDLPAPVDGVQDVGDPPLRAGLVLRDRRVVQEQEHRW